MISNNEIRDTDKVTDRHVSNHDHGPSPRSIIPGLAVPK